MEKRMMPEDALKGFGEGFDCSQVVLRYAAEKLGMDTDLALKVASAFGGGMWQGETCGCVTGALMALGLKYGHCKPDDADTKNLLLRKKKEFEDKFKEKNNSLICKEILGQDLSKPQGMQAIMEKGLLATVCPHLVCDACDILDKLL
ncbi:MAG: C-GCAxxG-C-C family protein [Oscillospiraceae bacterium]|nr:C-GCAxxG-C-C family protein [Oscillospiraceae bacterium]